jgi:hypothetical protein
VQILKCDKLYHGEISVSNRTFGAAPGSGSWIVTLPHIHLNRRRMTSDASIELTGESLAGNRQCHDSPGDDCRAPVAHSARRAATAADAPSPVGDTAVKIPFSGGDEPV